LTALRTVVTGRGGVDDGRVALEILKKISEKNSVVASLTCVLGNSTRSGEDLWRGYVEILKKPEMVEVSRILSAEIKTGASDTSVLFSFFQVLKIPAEEKPALINECEANIASLVSVGEGDDRTIRRCVALTAAKEFLKAGTRTSVSDFELHVQRIAHNPVQGLLELTECGIPRPNPVRAKRVKTPVRKRRRTLGLTLRERNGDDEEDEDDDDEDW
jgi:hypothetical protein